MFRDHVDALAVEHPCIAGQWRQVGNGLHTFRVAW
jgi:hypothetical protein